MKTTLALILFMSANTYAMFGALNTAATGMAAQETQVGTISNNIANVNTIGFKKQRAESEDLLYNTVTEAGARSSQNTQYNVGLQIGSGSKISAVRKEFSQGMPRITNNPFDLMINGEGFFGLVKPNNEVLYTRDGSFNVDQTGTVVNKQGYKLFPNFSFPQGTKSVSIGEDGTVEAYVNGQLEPVNLGQIPVFTFVNPVGLKSAGGNNYLITTASGEPIQNVAGQSNSGVVVQGSLENSNVNVMNEMTDLIRAQRAYEMNSKVMGVTDQMMQTLNNIR
ncbi:flagellar basal-body rod protein FlgG [Bacteriovorax sp. BSW11_IV]|uniref:flagellar basal-body rod protein FlgG n=1 Tax=Bacteriovorax sp. BSW11_IV TaxID=1353529 RepID=UPI00038A279B|nr:flagellar basal-body rod protein FlgG [Bacteriovorax sp. BSW11_IV]EQC45108.1 flagellar basal-body rod protein FlgG [Bacteriovorax sp. BSW11_IV]